MVVLNLIASDGRTLTCHTRIEPASPGLFGAGEFAAANLVRVRADGTSVYEPVVSRDPATGAIVPVPATEIVLDERFKVRAPGEPRHPAALGSRGGSASRAAARAVRIGNAIGAAFTGHRVLGPVEARLAAVTGLLLGVAAVLFAIFPFLFAYPAALLCAWGAVALLYKAHRLRRRKGRTPADGGRVAAA